MIVSNSCENVQLVYSTGGLEYECDAAPGDHDGHHHPQHQHTPRGQGKDQKTGELHKQPEVASNYILYKF